MTIGHSPMPRPHFTLRALLVAMLVVAAFCGGISFERERQRRAEPPGPEFKLSRKARAIQ